MDAWLDIATGAFALIAAILWFLSAYRKLPPMVTKWGATPEDDPFRTAIVFSAKMNKWASVLTGLSALCMALKTILHWA